MLSDSSELLQPRVQDSEACGRAAVRLRHLLSMLDKGEVSPEIIQNNIEYALRVLETFNISDKAGPPPPPLTSAAPGRRCPSEDEEDELSEVQQDAVPQEVREWLASTFTRQNTHKKRADGQPKFRTVANVIRMGIMVEKMTRRMSSSGLMEVPPAVTAALQSIDNWSYDVFRLSEASGGAPLRHLGYELINRYGLFHKFKIAVPHNATCSLADDTGTRQGSADGREKWYRCTNAVLGSGGRSSARCVTTPLDGTACCDLSWFCRLLRDEECNFLCNLAREEYTELRALVVDMVLATDMSSHFQQIKSMKNYSVNAESTVDKSKILNLVLHCCDISHPSKDWELHSHWTRLLLDEFFLQGDKEKELGLPLSPLCDRATTLVPQSQTGFIEFIVEPSMSVCGELLEKVAAYLHGAEGGAANGLDHKASEARGHASRPVYPWVSRPWEKCLTYNLEAWRRRQDACAICSASADAERHHTVLCCRADEQKAVGGTDSEDEADPQERAAEPPPPSGT
ncbi:calcium/calmodulin-dependent 3',5'-cyclic nucleotide phosphodiesterase 1-like [Pollicipes pollicipes]|uniref:calcium/calmodulin-dependent 3',5'-cyclic nucleotide phosphodiesterase 1-like n=1 Tax=Pollicipes pollicipes TaxID=41117 RepID=UPI001884F561|nr:calcium/calmodulin-dependent 3',5'-cyclic nucleotide phosphodiesterase 1-like [Pollicipes pollicipes]